MPTRIDGERCLDIRRRGKRGEYINPIDSKFCVLMFNKYPDWYSKTEAKVFNATVPFGSQVHKDEEILPPYSEGR